MTQKLTKKDKLTAIIAVLTGIDTEVATDELVAYCEKEIEALDKKAAKAKETAAKKKAEADELTEVIAGLLTDELQVTADITAQIDDEDVTTHKVSYRLTQLVKSGVAVKDDVVIPGKDGQKSRKIAGYKLAD